MHVIQLLGITLRMGQGRSFHLFSLDLQMLASMPDNSIFPGYHRRQVNCPRTDNLSPPFNRLGIREGSLPWAYQFVLVALQAVPLQKVLLSSSKPLSLSSLLATGVIKGSNGVAQKPFMLLRLKEASCKATRMIFGGRTRASSCLAFPCIQSRKQLLVYNPPSQLYCSVRQKRERYKLRSRDWSI